MEETLVPSFPFDVAGKRPEELRVRSVTRRKALAMLAVAPTMLGAGRARANDLLAWLLAQGGPRAGADPVLELPVAPGPFKGTRESLRQRQVPDWYPRRKVRHLGALGPAVQRGVRRLVCPQHVRAGQQTVRVSREDLWASL